MFQTTAPRRKDAESASEPFSELDLGHGARSRLRLLMRLRGVEGKNLHDAHMAGPRRRPLLALAGVLVVVACTALGALAGGRSSRTVAYLRVARFVPQGAKLTVADLESTTLSQLQGLTVLSAADAGQVIGRYAAVSLVPGNLLAAADVSSLGPLSPGQALVGADLAGDQLPPTLSVGDRVLVVLGGQGVGAPAGSASISSAGTGSATGAATSGTSGTPSAGATSGGLGGVASGAVLATGTVTDLFAASASSGTAEVVGIQVPSADAAGVAQASAAGDLSLAEISAARKP